MDFDDRPDSAKRLEQARIARGFKTIKDAAKFNGWVYETYQQHESGNRGFNKAADKYALAFRVSVGWLLTGEGRGPGSKPSLDEMAKDAPPEIQEAIYDFVERITKKAS